MKKKATAAMTALAVMVVPMTAFAGDFEDFYDYQAENGKYVYYFENGIKLEMPEDWYQNVTVEALVFTFYYLVWQQFFCLQEPMFCQHQKITESMWSRN